MTAASYPALLAGLPAACDADYAPRPHAALPTTPNALGFDHATGAVLGLACDGCGRDDAYLTESIAGTWACIDCIGDAAYDHEGDRR